MVSLPRLSMPKKSRNTRSNRSSAYVDFDQYNNNFLESAKDDNDAEEKAEEKEEYDNQGTLKHGGDKDFGSDSNSRSSRKIEGRSISRDKSKSSAKASFKSFRGFKVIQTMPRGNSRPSSITADKSPSNSDSAPASVQSARSNDTGGTKSSVAVTAKEDMVEAEHMNGDKGGEVEHGIATGRGGTDNLIADYIADEDGWPVTEESGDVAHVLVPLTSNKAVRSSLVPVTKTRSSESGASSAASSESPCIVASATMRSIKSSKSASSDLAKAAFLAASVEQGASRDEGRVPSSGLSAENHYLSSSLRDPAGNIETGVNNGMADELDPFINSTQHLDQRPPQAISADAVSNKNDDKSLASMMKESLFRSLGSALSPANDTLAPTLDPSMRSIAAKSSRSASLAKSSTSASFGVASDGTSRDEMDMKTKEASRAASLRSLKAMSLNIRASGSASSGTSNTPSLMDNNSDGDYSDDERTDKVNAAAAQTPRASNICIVPFKEGGNDEEHADYEDKENIGAMVETPRARSGCLSGSNEILQDLAQSFGNGNRSGSRRAREFFNDEQEDGNTRKSVMTRSTGSARSRGGRISFGSSKGALEGGRTSMGADRAKNEASKSSRAIGQDNSSDDDVASTLSGKAFGGSMAGSIAISQASSKRWKSEENEGDMATRRVSQSGGVSTRGVTEDGIDLVSARANTSSRGSSLSVDMGEETNDNDDVEEMYSDFEVAEHDGKKSFRHLPRPRSLRSFRRSRPHSPRSYSMRFLGKAKRQSSAFRRAASEPVVVSNAVSSRKGKQHASVVSDSGPSVDINEEITGDTEEKSTVESNTISPMRLSRFYSVPSLRKLRRKSTMKATFSRAASEPAVRSCPGSSRNNEAQSVAFSCAATISNVRSSTDSPREVKEGNTFVSRATSEPALRLSADSFKISKRGSDVHRAASEPAMSAGSHCGAVPNTEYGSVRDYERESSRGLDEANADATPWETETNGSDGANRAPTDGVADDSAEPPAPFVTSDRGAPGMNVDSDEPDIEWCGFAEDGCGMYGAHDDSMPPEGAFASTDPPDGCRVAQEQHPLGEGDTPSSWAVDLDPVDLVLPFLQHYDGGSSRPSGVYQHPRMIEQHSGRPVNIVHIEYF